MGEKGGTLTPFVIILGAFLMCYNLFQALCLCRIILVPLALFVPLSGRGLGWLRGAKRALWTRLVWEAIRGTRRAREPEGSGEESSFLAPHPSLLSSRSPRCLPVSTPLLHVSVRLERARWLSVTNC